MIAADKVALVLLAAGLSHRYGARDKLGELLDGTPLGLHAARTLAALPFAARIAVTRDGGPDFAAEGFAVARNPDPGSGQSGSIRIGVARARLARPGAMLIALADMPFVTVAHVEAMLARFDRQHPVVASASGGVSGPPALFAEPLFEALAAVEGDRGARHLLRDATWVEAPAAMMIDIDTPQDLAAIAAGRAEPPRL